MKSFLHNLWHWRTAWAVRHLSKQLQNDKAFRDSWQANIAMPIYDALRLECTCFIQTVEDCEKDHVPECIWSPERRAEREAVLQRIDLEACNKMADRLMKHLFNA